MQWMCINQTHLFDFRFIIQDVLFDKTKANFRFFNSSINLIMDDAYKYNEAMTYLTYL